MVMVMAMMLNATFNNISAISWQSVLLVEETEVLRENTKPLIQEVKKVVPLHKKVEIIYNVWQR
jgi:hypothetical protein